MSNEMTVYSLPEIKEIGGIIARSGLFGVKTPEHAVALCLIAQAEGIHPAQAANDYHVVQGRPTKKAEAMLRDFMRSGGKVEWHTLNDDCADATFSHPQGGTVRISWDLARVKKAQISNAAMYAKYTRAMLRSRTVSEGVRTVCPAATSGMYEPGEAAGFDPEPIVIEQKVAAQEEQKLVKSPKAASPKVDSESQKLQKSAKEMASEIELCPDEACLQAVLVRFADTTDALARNLPQWHDRLLGVVEKQRASFAPSDETGATLGGA